MNELIAAGVVSFPNIDPVIFSLGPIAIRWYSMAYIGGIMFAWWYIRRETEKPGAPLSATHIDDFITWGMLAIIVGGRLGYVLFYNFQAYLHHPGRIIRVWDGGMSFHGGLIGVVIALAIYVHRHKLDLFKVGDIVAVVSPIGLLAGRLANFINGELWGRPTDVSWAMIFPTDRLQLPRHPSQLYEALGEGLILFIILHLLYHKTRLAKQAPGVIAGLFFVGYGITRFLVEFVREPDSHLGLMEIGLSRGQLLTFPMFIFAGWLIYRGLQTKRANA
ncbi:prolipoprotein diacylglyceryl transferase [Kordiimonas aquimaris]|uniref:prolipoprotein diacylglyceryl transferase n=1 Tax=Kordiimonas aquimaris TaxID=707591 RepID=UPI0021D12D83|nr:prolipoprotein diacylglyceryl transferase [Kordiimonas aquimaris]